MTVVVTGSASGIGAATSAALRAAGHDVLGIDLRDAEVTVDLTDERARAAAIDEVSRQCGGVLDSLVVCAGLGPHVPDPNAVLAVNYHAAVAVLDGLFPALQRGSSPAAVVVSSVASTHVSWEDNPIANGTAQAALAEAGDGAGYLAYTWSKNAVTVAVRQRATAWGAAGVRINTVAPGTVNTPLLQAGLDDPRYGPAIRGFTAPIGRSGDPTEIAALIEYLLGPRAGFVHGSQFIIDGGTDAQMRPTTF